MSSEVISIKSRKQIVTKSFEVGQYLWWGYAHDTESGYPIQITAIDSAKATLYFISLNDALMRESQCPMNYPHIHPTDKTTVETFIQHHLLRNEVHQTYLNLLKEAWKRFKKNLASHREEKRFYAAYKAKLKQLNL